MRRYLYDALVRLGAATSPRTSTATARFLKAQASCYSELASPGVRDITALRLVAAHPQVHPHTVPQPKHPSASSSSFETAANARIPGNCRILNGSCRTIVTSTRGLHLALGLNYQRTAYSTTTDSVGTATAEAETHLSRYETIRRQKFPDEPVYDIGKAGQRKTLSPAAGRRNLVRRAIAKEKLVMLARAKLKYQKKEVKKARYEEKLRRRADAKERIRLYSQRVGGLNGSSEPIPRVGSFN
eukprot:scaffold8171_cov269-Prasinococcus_capsulatus_cf.AAC.1